jgi:hypothetical protein
LWANLNLAVNLFGSAERRLNDIRNVSDCGAYLFRDGPRSLG